MAEFSVPETPGGEEFEFAGLRIVPNPDVPEGMVEVRDADGRLERRFDWGSDFRRWREES